LLLLALLSGCATTQPQGLRPFSSDGCSLFPDRGLGKGDWCGCCLAHDLAYWRGGTEAQRLQADEKLRSCVAARTGDAILAENMRAGVHAGGSPALPTPFRWGYGWPAGRGYEPLSPEESAVADALVERWRAQGAPQACSIP
jgi:hypothetical protein